MLNINLKIEAKNGYVIDANLITFSDMPRSQELKMYYDVFEDSFLKKYQIIKASKRLKSRVEFKNYMTERQNELSLKISKLSNSQIYINNKISFLTYPFPSEDVYTKRMKLEAQFERINQIIVLMKDEISNIYFGLNINN